MNEQTDGCETVTFTKVVRIADVNDEPIRIGSVIKKIGEETSGIVTNIMKVGDRGIVGLEQVGDLTIKVRHGCEHHTNQYAKWIHIPREDQTYWQRYYSWLMTPYDHDCELYRTNNKREATAIDGIMSLLPTDPVDWEYGECPDRIEIALDFLQKHLHELELKTKVD